MKRKFLSMAALVLAITISTFGLTSCNGVSVDAGEEAVLIMQPWFFGHGGVCKEPAKTGMEWIALTTSAVKYKVVPIAYDESLEDVMSNQNTPLDFHIQIILQIQEGKSPILHENYGPNWYESNLQRVFMNEARALISEYSMFDLMSNREVLNDIDKQIKKYMENYIVELSTTKEMPVTVVNVITGKAIPNKPQLEEMNKTAQYQQAKQSMEQKLEAEKARAEAEKQRAIADKAYMAEMNLSPEEFIQLRAWEIIEKKDGANIDILVGSGEQPMWNIRR